MRSLFLYCNRRRFAPAHCRLLDGEGRAHRGGVRDLAARPPSRSADHGVQAMKAEARLPAIAKDAGFRAEKNVRRPWSAPKPLAT